MKETPSTITCTSDQGNSGLMLAITIDRSACGSVFRLGDGGWAQANKKGEPMSRINKILLALTAFVLLGPGASIAKADDCFSVVGNMVTNCGFETGDFTGWTVNPSGTAFVTDPSAHSGNFGAASELSLNLHLGPLHRALRRYLARPTI